jgi:uncharacterized protein
MAAGLGVIKEAGTDRFANRFHDSGYSVLAFDYRRLGESGGTPRQLVRIGDQLADWQAAIRFASTLPGVDSDKLSIWGFSVSGGHVFTVAARNPGLAAAIAHAPLADGPAIRAAQRAPRGQLARLPGGHYAAFLDAEDQTAQALLSFLDRELTARRKVAR